VTVLSTLLFTWVFPVGLLIEAKGPYKIGTASLVVKSDDRRELYGDKYDTLRSFAVQFYFPSDTGGERPAPLFENGEAIELGFKNAFGIPKMGVDYFSQLPSNVWYDTKLSTSEDQYPVIVLSHGWKGFRNIHANIAEKMASNGYIVVAIDHTYGALATQIKSDEVVLLNHAALPNRETHLQYLKYGSALIETYKGDILETLDLIEDMNQAGYNSILTERMNLGKITVLGHSTGGGAAVSAALSDSRISAVVGLDAWVEPLDDISILSGLKVPYLHLSSEAWRGGVNEKNLNMLIANSSEDRWLITLEGTKHTDFTMLGYLSPVSEQIKLTGKNGKEAIEIQEKLIYKFIDYYSNGRNTKKAIVDIIKEYDSATAEAIYMR